MNFPDFETVITKGENAIPDSVSAVLSKALYGTDELVVFSGEIDGLGRRLAQLLQQNPAGIAELRLGNALLRDVGADPLLRTLAIWDPSAPSHLRLLDLTSNSLTAPSALMLADVLRHNLTLTDVDLSYNNIGDEGAAALGAALKPNNTFFSVVEKLVLRRCSIGEKGGAALGAALVGNRVLYHLNLSGNRIRMGGSNELGRALKAADKKTAEAVTSGAEPGSHSTASPGLVTLLLCDCAVENIRDLATSVYDNRTLLELHLSGNPFGDDDMGELAAALRLQALLQVLVLSACHLSDGGARALASTVATHKKMAVLRIGNNIIGDPGVLALSRAFEQNGSVHTFTLNDNCVTPRGFVALFTSMKVNRCVMTLDVSGNSGSFGNAALSFSRALSALLASNAQLVHIDLSRCEVLDEGFDAVCAAAAENATLTTLRIDQNRLSRDMQLNLERSMARELKPAGHILDTWMQSKDNHEKVLQERRRAKKEGSQTAKTPDESHRNPSDGADKATTKTGKANPDAEEPKIDPAISELRPGQKLKVAINLGRQANQIADIIAGGDITLEMARELIEKALTQKLNEDYDFIDLDGCIIPTEEEDKKMLLWECGRSVLLRPKSWIVL